MEDRNHMIKTILTQAQDLGAEPQDVERLNSELKSLEVSALEKRFRIAQPAD